MKQDRAEDDMRPLMQEVLTEELKPKDTEQPGGGEEARKNPVDQASKFPDCTREELELRCNVETAVLTRILHFPLHV
jgi:hypothetical protein